MTNSDPFHQLKYQHEILRARHEIREHHLNTFVREVYENIGQVLSLVGMELAILQQENSTFSKSKVDRLGELVRDAIRDLRHLGGNLYMEPISPQADDLINLLNNEIELRKLGSPELRIKIKGKPRVLEPGVGLILYSIIKQILTSISRGGSLLSVYAIYSCDKLTFTIQYQGEQEEIVPMPTNLRGQEAVLSLEEKIQLINGKLELPKYIPGQSHHEIKLEFKNLFNE